MMQKILLYIFSYAFFFAGGVVVGMLIDSDHKYKVVIRKIKQRGRGNVLDSDLDVNLTPENKPSGKKRRFKELRNKLKSRRDDRKARRKARRNGE